MCYWLWWCSFNWAFNSVYLSMTISYWFVTATHADCAVLCILHSPSEFTWRCEVRSVEFKSWENKGGIGRWIEMLIRNPDNNPITQIGGNLCGTRETYWCSLTVLLIFEVFVFNSKEAVMAVYWGNGKWIMSGDSGSGEEVSNLEHQFV